MAKGEVVGLTKTFKSEGDMSAAALRYTFVDMSGDQTVDTCGAAGQGIGIQKNLPVGDAAGAPIVVQLNGTSKLLVDGNADAIVAGSFLECNGAGKGILGDAGAGTPRLAIALEGSTADDDIIEVLILHLNEPA